MNRGILVAIGLLTTAAVAGAAYYVTPVHTARVDVPPAWVEGTPEQGFQSRFTPQEIYRIGKTDISALSNFLADKPFFMGAQPTSLDASAYASLANLLWAPTRSPLTAHAESLPNLAAYCARMKARSWP